MEDRAQPMGLRLAPSRSCDKIQGGSYVNAFEAMATYALARRQAKIFSENRHRPERDLGGGNGAGADA